MTGPRPAVIPVPNDTFPRDRVLTGQVEVADGVALADRVVLDAAPGCRLVLAPGVCLGSGVIIQAVRGDLVIEPGAVLGQGVLVFGAGRIGQNACIGAESTLINPAISSSQVVPPNSLLGDPSRTLGSRTDAAPPVEVSPAPAVSPAEVASLAAVEALEPPADPWPETVSAPADDATHAPVPNPAKADGAVIAGTDSDPTDHAATGANQPPPSPAHGQKQVQALLATLFPHRQPLNGVSPEDKP